MCVQTNDQFNKMKKRLKLKYLAIALLVETLLLAFKQPIYYMMGSIESFDPTLAMLLNGYYTYCYKIVKCIIYGTFVFSILKVEETYKHRFFGKFFVADWLMCGVDAAIVFFFLFLPDLATTARHYTEVIIALGMAATSFLAGTFIYTKVHSRAFRTIRTAYRLWAMRYVIYALLLVGEVSLNVWGHMGYMEMGTYDWWVITSWCLRMPLLILSRCILLYGIMQMKTSDEIHKEHKLKGISHHHHHHHHHHEHISTIRLEPLSTAQMADA